PLPISPLVPYTTLFRSVEAVRRGVDMMDCVLPTRNARNGHLFTSEGVVRIRNAAHRHDMRPIDENCDCYTCQNFTRSYVHHLNRDRKSTRLNSSHVSIS